VFLKGLMTSPVLFVLGQQHTGSFQKLAQASKADLEKMLCGYVLVCGMVEEILGDGDLMEICDD